MKNPEIRFIDDNIDWQNKKIEDILEPYAEKNINNYPSVAIGRYGIRKREEIYSKELTKDTTKNKVINKNTLTVGMGSTQIDIGILHTDEHFSVSPAYHTFNILDNDSKFIESSFAKNNEKYSKQHMIIGARQGKSVDFPNFLADTIYLPPMKVQQEIASLLTNIEDKITKQENLIQKLKDTKSSLLLKMFPQENQSVPELRFDGFTNDWEQRKLNNLILDIADGPFGSNLKAIHYTNNKEVRIIQLSNIGDDGWQDENIKYTTFKHSENIKRSVVNEGELVMAKMMPAGMTIECPNVDHMYVLSSDSVRIKFDNNKIANNFFLAYTKSYPFLIQIENDIQGSTRARTSISKIKQISIPLPSIEEQVKIGNYFSTLNSIITLHQRKPFHLNFSL